MGVAAAIEGAGIPRMKGPSSCHSQCKWFAVSSPRTPITGRRKTNADGTTSSAYLRVTVYEDRPRVRQKDGSYTDNPLGPVRTTVKFWGQAAELLHGMDFRQGDAVVATGRMGDPDAFISQKDGKAYARPVVIGDSMQIDSIVSQRIQLARERKRQTRNRPVPWPMPGERTHGRTRLTPRAANTLATAFPALSTASPSNRCRAIRHRARLPLRRTLRHRIPFHPIRFHDGQRPLAMTQALAHRRRDRFHRFRRHA